MFEKKQVFGSDIIYRKKNLLSRNWIIILTFCHDFEGDQWSWCSVSKYVWILYPNNTFKVEIRAHARHDFDKKGVLILDLIC